MHLWANIRQFVAVKKLRILNGAVAGQSYVVCADRQQPECQILLSKQHYDKLLGEFETIILM